MAGNILTISLTDQQKQQIRAATGKNISELNIDLSSTGSLSEKISIKWPGERFTLNMAPLSMTNPFAT
jgi:hypothetical protein